MEQKLTFHATNQHLSLRILKFPNEFRPSKPEPAPRDRF